MSRKSGKPSKDALRRLVEEYDFLLTSSDALGISLDTESEILKDIMDQHPEYKRYKPGEEIRTRNGAVVNPRLHIALEALVETQIAKNDPPEAREAYLKLQSLGVDAHEARHAVSRVFLGVVYLIMKRRLTHDPNSVYRSQLSELTRAGLNHKVFTDYR